MRHWACWEGKDSQGRSWPGQNHKIFNSEEEMKAFEAKLHKQGKHFLTWHGVPSQKDILTAARKALRGEGSGSAITKGDKLYLSISHKEIPDGPSRGGGTSKEAAALIRKKLHCQAFLKCSRSEISGEICYIYVGPVKAKPGVYSTGPGKILLIR